MTDVQENIIEDEDGPVLEDPVEEEDVADSIEKDESDDDDESDEDDEDDDDDLPWYKDEYFWLGEQTSDGYDWDDRSVGYRVKKVLNVNGGRLAQTMKVGVHLGWIPVILVLGMNHPVNGITPSLGDLFASLA